MNTLFENAAVFVYILGFAFFLCCGAAALYRLGVVLHIIPRRFDEH